MDEKYCLSNSAFEKWYTSLDELTKKDLLRGYYLLNANANADINTNHEEITPSSKGQTGELIVEELLKKYYHIVLSNTTKSGKASDFQIKIMSYTREILILIEVKNYSPNSKVSTKEVAKFYRDLNTTNADCGIFISLNSKITGFDCPIKLVDHIATKGSVGVIFLSVFKSMPEDILCTLIDILVQSFKSQEVVSQRDLSTKIKKINDTVLLVRSTQEYLSELTTGLFKMNSMLSVVDCTLCSMLS